MRILISVLTIIATGFIGALPMKDANADNWASFKTAHIADSGAVTDDGPRVDATFGLVHSEGQSYAMLLAVKNGDRETFDKAWRFAKNHMRRADGLFSWRIENGKITDDNNASDAEIVMAWALLEAGKAWGDDYLADASHLIATIRTNLIVSAKDPKDPSRILLLILPGIQGFHHEDGTIVLNPSYWVFPAIDAFGKFDDPIFWAEVAKSGERLIALSSSSGLTPDWVSFPGMGPAPKLSSKSSYDALRVPLWMSWSGRSSPTFAGWRQLWRERKAAWIDYSTGEVADYAPGPEQLSVLNLLDRAASSPEGVIGAMPIIGLRTPYYASAITQLARIAWKERFSE
jgi:endoglucanase